MPPKHRPTPPIPGTFEFLTTPRWLPVLLFWLLIFGITYFIWLLG
jgi:hypothetical protein